LFFRFFFTFSPFTKILSRFYSSIVRQNGPDALTIVFISSDSNENEMLEYYMEEHGNWLTVPYVKRDLKQSLSTQYKISGVPTCILLNPKMEEISGSHYLNNENIRNMLTPLPEVDGPEHDAQAQQIFEKMKNAVMKSMGKSILPAANHQMNTRASSYFLYKPDDVIDKTNVDIFCSLKFSEAQEQAQQLVVQLKKSGLNAVIIDGNLMEENPEDMSEQVADLLDASKMVIIFGTESYGKATASTFSTKEELQFVMAEKKPFYLIKMCERFQDSRTRFYLPNESVATNWLPSEEMPSDLMESILLKYQSEVIDK
jgi:hypothetical protein